MTKSNDKASEADGRLSSLGYFGLPPAAEEAKSEQNDSAVYGGLSKPAIEWLKKSEARVMANSNFRKALTAITELQAMPEGIQNYSEMFCSLLVWLAILAVTPKSGNRAIWEKFWSWKTGKTWRQLEDFPDRIDKMANEVELVKRSPFFAPATFITGKTLKGRVARQRVEQLPGIMRFYAEGLRRQIKQAPMLMSKISRPIQRGDDTLATLSFVIGIITGKPRDRLGAELVNAASNALGEDENRQIDALTIAQARFRWKKYKKS
jgi:hypothetical protein